MHHGGEVNNVLLDMSGEKADELCSGFKKILLFAKFKPKKKRMGSQKLLAVILRVASQGMAYFVNHLWNYRK